MEEEENSNLKENSEIIIEGILESCDSNSCFIILSEAIILRVYGPDPYD